MGILHSTNKHLKIVKQSATSDHNNFNLLIKESLLIAHNKPNLNKTVKSFPLELFE